MQQGTDIFWRKNSEVENNEENPVHQRKLHPVIITLLRGGRLAGLSLNRKSWTTFLGHRETEPTSEDLAFTLLSFIFSLFLEEFYLCVTDSLRISFMKQEVPDQKSPTSLKVQGCRSGPPWEFSSQAWCLGAASSLGNSLQALYV